MPEFGLNQITMRTAPFDLFVETAAQLGCVGVEVRNDMGRALFDGLDADAAGRRIRAAGMRLLGVSQIQPFNRWSPEIACQTQALIEVAQAAGAETISLIPANDGSGCAEPDRGAKMRYALEACLPLLDAAGMMALVEPLGFERSSLTSKVELVAAIKELGAEHRVKLVHDTFHHTLAGGGDIHPEATGLVHISGASVQDVPVQALEDSHRILVDGGDRLGTAGQMSDLLAAGYAGVFSFECFAPEVHALAQPQEAIRTSMNFISAQLTQRAA